jgi:hypothetical protein
MRAADATSREREHEGRLAGPVGLCPHEAVVDEAAGRVLDRGSRPVRGRGARERQEEEDDGGADLHQWPRSRPASRESAA